MTCGLDYLMGRFDFVGSMSNIANHTRTLLEQVGIWDTYGATFDDGAGENVVKQRQNRCAVPPPVRTSSTNASDIIPGFNQRGASVGQSHATGSKSRLDQYYTPELLEKVKRAYAMDYAIFDELNSRSNQRPMKGSEFRLVREYCEKEQKK